MLSRHQPSRPRNLGGGAAKLGRSRLHVVILMAILIGAANTPAFAASQSNWRLAPKGEISCDFGRVATEGECKDASEQIMAKDYPGKSTGQTVQIQRSGGSCGNTDRWSSHSADSIPPGCSLQTGGDWTPHYKWDITDSFNCNSYDERYQLVCTDVSQVGFWANARDQFKDVVFEVLEHAGKAGVNMGIETLKNKIMPESVTQIADFTSQIVTHTDGSIPDLQQPKTSSKSKNGRQKAKFEQNDKRTQKPHPQYRIPVKEEVNNGNKNGGNRKRVRKNGSKGQQNKK